MTVLEFPPVTEKRIEKVLLQIKSKRILVIPFITYSKLWSRIEKFQLASVSEELIKELSRCSSGDLRWSASCSSFNILQYKGGELYSRQAILQLQFLSSSALSLSSSYSKPLSSNELTLMTSSRDASINGLHAIGKLLAAKLGPIHP